MSLTSIQQKVAGLQRDAAVAHTGLNVATYNAAKRPSRDQLPVAMMTYTTGAPYSQATPEKDVLLNQVWAIWGRDPDEVSVILEQLMFLWYKSDVRPDLEAAGFIKYELTDITAAQPVEDHDLPGGYMGVIEFEVRMKIQNPY